ncbi:pyridoxamine 5'-phosphate oxidase family protein [Actinopolymorpha sp. B17G11]|uniref:pyridoxamine 5'-phosphate oxidase family protein n=1 Tax=Actinopolymorpha sp. B17G11 TaxID=3160861 RepID=UPI0032E4EA9E
MRDVEPTESATSTRRDELAATARAILDATLYMTLGTVDSDGNPWTTPVYYGTADYTDFYWISTPEAAHSRNLSRHPRLSIVVFNSAVPLGEGQAVYMSGVGEELTGPELDRGLEIYPGAPERGAYAMTREQVQPPAAYRLYRARACEHFVLCPRESGGPCSEHGLTTNHRTAVTLSQDVTRGTSRRGQ